VEQKLTYIFLSIFASTRTDPLELSTYEWWKDHYVDMIIIALVFVPNIQMLLSVGNLKRRGQGE
jgi:hypothetical protein